MLTAILSLHCLSRLSATKDYKGPAHTLSNYNFKPVFDQNATRACSRYLVWFPINAITKFTDLQPDNLSCADKSCVSVWNWFAIVVVTCVLGLRVRRLDCLTRVYNSFDKWNSRLIQGFQGWFWKNSRLSHICILKILSIYNIDIKNKLEILLSDVNS